MVSVMLYHCIFGVALFIDMFVLCVACLIMFVNCLVTQFAICLGVVVTLLLYFMEELRVWSSKECVCCACDPSVHFISFGYVCVCRNKSHHLGV